MLVEVTGVHQQASYERWVLTLMLQAQVLEIQ
jgi:hypothetical protein